MNASERIKLMKLVKDLFAKYPEICAKSRNGPQSGEGYKAPVADFAMTPTGSEYTLALTFTKV